MANKFLTNIELDGDLIDINGNSGTAGQVLSSLGSGNGVDWIDIASDTAERIEVTVKNVSGGSLSKGTVVHASPSATPPSGNVIEVIAADYDDSTKMPAIGILNETIADTAEGSAVMIGAVSGIDTSSFSIGDELYVGNLGALTSTKPATAGQLIQKIAVVIKSHASNGLIKIFGAGRSNDVPLPLYIDNTNQRVGIGVALPDHKLHLEESDTTSVFLKTENTAGALLVGNNSAGNSFVSSQTSGKDLLFETANTERVRIGSAGQIGIGGANYGTSGQVLTSNGSGSAPSWQNAGAASLSGGAANKLAIWSGTAALTNDTNLHWDTSNDRLGIGTPSPSHSLHVHSDTDNNYIARFEGSTNNGAGVWTGIGIGGESNNTKSAIIFEDIGVSYSRGKLHLAVNNEQNQNNATKSDAKLTVSNDGDVGIGTTSPAQTLNVVNTSDYQLRLGTPISSAVYWEIGRDNVTTGDFLFSNNTGEKMRITSGGDVGIGTSSPAEKLHINGKVRIGDYMKMDSNANYMGIIGFNRDTSNGNIYNSSYAAYQLQNQQGELYLQVYNSGGSLVTQHAFDNSGNVGIGTSSPDQKLHVHKASAGTVSSNSNAIITAENNANGYIHILVPDSNESGVLFGNPSSSVNGAIVYNNSGTSNGLQFRTSGNSTKMVIDSSGNVGIGTASPGSTLDISKAAGNAWMHLINGTESAFRLTTYNNGTGNGTGSYAFKHGLYYNTTENAAITFWRGGSSVGGFLTFTTNNGSERMRIHSNGNISVGTVNAHARFSVKATSHNNGISVNRQADTTAALYIGNDGGNNPILAANNADMLFGRDLSGTFTERMRLTNSGNLGIGAPIPSQKLHVNGRGLFQTGGSTADATTGTYEKGITLTGGNMRLVIDTSNVTNGGSYIQTRHSSTTYPNAYYTLALNPLGGKVGIGTTSPSQKLHVAGNVTADRYYGNSSTVYYVDPNDSTTSLNTAGSATFSGSVTGSSFVKSGGTSSQFLKADGSVDSSTYLTSLNFSDLSNKESGTGTYSTSGFLEAGRGNGGVALTHNDSYGNANVTFNHRSGTPEQAGSSGRIVVTTDSTTAKMTFELKDNVSSGTAVNTPSVMELNTSGAYILGTLDLGNSTDTTLSRHSAGNISIQSNRVFHDGYHPNADKWTTSRTLTLSGDVTGSVTFDGSGDIDMTNTAVANDSHNHDGRYYTETESDSRFVNVTGDTMSGTLVVGGGNGIGDGKMAVRGGDLLLDRGKELRWNTGSGSGEYIYSKTSSPYDVTIHSGSYDALQAPNTGEVRINYQGSQKFVTTSSGVSITGNIAVSGTVDGVDIAAFKSAYDNHDHDSDYVNVTGDTINGDLTVTGGGTGILVDTSTHASVRLDRASTSYDNNLLFYTAGSLKWRLWQDGSDDYLYVRNESGSNNLMTFRSNNTVGINTGTPNATLHLQIPGAAAPSIFLQAATNFAPGIYFDDSNTGTSAAGAITYATANNTFSIKANSTSVVTISSGTTTIAATADIVAYSSDKRLKENVQPIEKPLNKVLKLEGVTYNWNKKAEDVAGFDTEIKEVGLFAQDVQKVLPEAVKLAPFDTGEDFKSKSGEDYLTVQYEKIVPLLVEAIKDQQKQIDELKSIINGGS